MSQRDTILQEDTDIATQAIVELTEANVPPAEPDAWQDEVDFLRDELVESDAPSWDAIDEVIDLSTLLA